MDFTYHQVCRLASPTAQLRKEHKRKPIHDEMAMGRAEPISCGLKRDKGPYLARNLLEFVYREAITYDGQVMPRRMRAIVVISKLYGSVASWNRRPHQSTGGSNSTIDWTHKVGTERRNFHCRHANKQVKKDQVQNIVHKQLESTAS